MAMFMRCTCMRRHAVAVDLRVRALRPGQRAERFSSMLYQANWLQLGLTCDFLVGTRKCTRSFFPLFHLFFLILFFSFYFFFLISFLFSFIFPLPFLFLCFIFFHPFYFSFTFILVYLINDFSLFHTFIFML